MKAILVGLGGRGKTWWNACREHPDVEVVACVEPSAANKERAVKDWGIDAKLLHDDLSVALKKVKADFVVDVTPPAVHEKIALTAFENGLDVLGEKPLSDDFAAVKRIVDAGKRAKRKHMITQNYRFNALPRTTHRLLKEGIIGTPSQLDIQFFVPWADLPGSHYVTQPYMFLTDMGIHHFDMMRYVLGADPVSVQTVTWNLPWGWHKGDASHVAVFRYASGMIAVHRAMGCELGKRTTYNGEWRIEGDKGSLTWEEAKAFHTWSHRVEPNGKGEKIRTELPLDEPQGPEAKLNPVLAEFVNARKQNRQPECSAEDNLKSMAMVFAAVKSAQEKREVKLSEL